MSRASQIVIIAHTFAHFCSKQTLWTLCLVSKSFHLYFLQRAIGKTKWLFHKIPHMRYFPFITNLWMQYPHFVAIEHFPKLECLRVHCICHLRRASPLPRSITTVRIDGLCEEPTSDCEVDSDFPWSSTLLSLKLGFKVSNPFHSWPPSLTFLDLDYDHIAAAHGVQTLPSSIVDLRLWDYNGSLRLPLCSLLTLRAAQWDSSVIFKTDLNSSLTNLNLPSFTGFIHHDALPPMLQVLKLRRFSEKCPRFPNSITTLTLGYIPPLYELPLVLQSVRPTMRNRMRQSISYYKWKIC